MLRRLAGHREGRALFLLVLILIFGALKAPRLLEGPSISSILLAMPLFLVVATGQMFVVVSRGIDVSVGSTLGLCGMLIGLGFRANPGLNLGLAVVICLAMGAVLGLLNGALIAYAKIPPIITTLGTLSAYRGAVFVVSHGQQIDSNDIPLPLTAWSREGPLAIGGVTLPWLVVIAAFVAVIGWVIAQKTRFGRNVYTLGSYPEAAALRGVPVTKTLLAVYAMVGSVAGLGGLLYASRYGFVNPATAGQGLELTVIAATVIGGCDVRGGSGSILGVVLGCALLATVNVALSVLGIAADYQLLVYGVVILLALGLDAVVKRA